VGKTTVTVKSNQNPEVTDTCTIVVVNQLHGNTITVPAEESTCTTHGHAEYVICQDCGTIMSGSNEEYPLAKHKGGTATCNAKAICEVCNQEYGFFDINNHTTTEVRNAVKATTENEGYTGDTFCTDCGKLLAKGEVIPVLPNEPEPETKPEVKPQPPVKEPEKEQTPEVKLELPVEEEKPEPVPEPESEKNDVPKTGDNFNMTVWITLLVVSFVGIIGMGRSLKPKKAKRMK